jgi:biopolymer transport protein ExbD
MSFTQSIHEPAADINVTPLVDVMLVLLIIFMVTAPSLTFSNPLVLPQSTIVDAPPPLTPIELSVSSDGRLRWNQRAVSATQLNAELRGLASLSETQQPSLNIQIDDDVPYQALVSLMAQINNLGLKKIRLE